MQYLDRRVEDGNIFKYLYLINLDGSVVYPKGDLASISVKDNVTDKGPLLELFSEHRYFLIKINAEPHQYLAIDRKLNPFAKRWRDRRKRNFIQTFLFLLAATVVGTTLTLGFVYITMIYRVEGGGPGDLPIETRKFESPTSH